MFILHAKIQQNDDLRGNEQSINEVFYSWHVNVFHKIKIFVYYDVERIQI